MHNVLLLNPEIPTTFWTFRDACKMVRKKALLPPLGILTMAALLPKDWRLTFVDLVVRPVTEAEWSWADLVMITGMHVQADSFLELLREAKRRGKRVVCGGPYVTAVPQPALNAGCDVLVRGECEETISQVLLAIESSVSGIVIQNQEKPDVSNTPAPRYDLVNVDDYMALGLQTSRGCPFLCEFCDVIQLYGRKPRYKSPKQVVHELSAIEATGFDGIVFITDDNFIGNRKYAHLVLDALIPWSKSNGEPFSFWTQASINLGQDRETIDRMTEANFSTVFVGVESTDSQVLTRTEKHQNVRNPLMESLENINKNGLSVIGGFVIGFDGEKSGIGDSIGDFVERSGLPNFNLNILQALPETKLWDRLAAEGRLKDGMADINTRIAAMNFVPTRPEREIQFEFIRTWRRLTHPESSLARIYRSILEMRPTRAAMRKMNLEAPRESIPSPPSLRQRRGRWTDRIAFFVLCWRHGVLASHRLQWWRQLIGVLRHNPSRIARYFDMVFLMENARRLYPADFLETSLEKAHPIPADE